MTDTLDTIYFDKSVLIEFMPSTFSINRDSNTKGLKPYIAYDLTEMKKIYQAKVYHTEEVENLNLDISFLSKYNTMYCTFSDGTTVEWYSANISCAPSTENELFVFDIDHIVKCNTDEVTMLNKKLPQYLEKAQEMFDANKNLSMYSNEKHKQL